VHLPAYEDGTDRVIRINTPSNSFPGIAPAYNTYEDGTDRVFRNVGI